MAHPIVMPSFGMYTAEGTLHAWSRADGALVQAGDPIAEIETEKSTNEITAPATGRLCHVARPGAPLKEQDVFGYILGQGESAPGASAGARPSGACATTAPPAPQKAEAPATTPSTTPAGTPAGTSAATPATTPTSTPAATPGWVRASPVARKIARENDIDLSTVRGTGPGGRVVGQDVRDALERRRAAATAAPAASLLPAVRAQAGLSTIRRTIAQRLRQSQSTAVSLTLTRDAPARRLATARKRFSTELGMAVAYDAYFAKCIAMALREFGHLNAMIRDDALIVFEDIHIGVAVDLPDGLIVPVLRHVDRTPLRTLAVRIRDLAARARANALRTEELIGGTFSLTNLGGFGIDAFTPVLNPPQSGILGIGRIQPRVIARPDGAIAVEQTTTLSLTFDHRVADGAPAARLLDRIVYWMNDEEFLARMEKEHES